MKGLRHWTFMETRFSCRDSSATWCWKRAGPRAIWCGELELRVENAMALEMPAKPAWSNSLEPLEGGWPSYEFGDGSNGFSGILRKPTGEPAVRVYSRSIADTPNRFTVEFQDALNEYQQDSYELVDPVDIALCGQEVSITLPASGIPNFDQAGRLLKV